MQNHWSKYKKCRDGGMMAVVMLLDIKQLQHQHTHTHVIPTANTSSCDQELNWQHSKHEGTFHRYNTTQKK